MKCNIFIKFNKGDICLINILHLISTATYLLVLK